MGSAGAAGWLCRAQCAAAAGLAVSGACDACHAPWRRPSSKLGAQDQASQVGGGGGVRVYAAAVRWPWAIIRSASPVARKPCRRATPATRPSAPPAKPRNCSRSAAARSAAARRADGPSAAAAGSHHPRGWAIAKFSSVALASLSLSNPARRVRCQRRGLVVSFSRSLVLSLSCIHISATLVLLQSVRQLRGHVGRPPRQPRVQARRVPGVPRRAARAATARSCAGGCAATRSRGFPGRVRQRTSDLASTTVGLYAPLGRSKPGRAF